MQSNGQYLLKRCTGGQWMHMCGIMDQADAQVICRQLGMSTLGVYNGRKGIISGVASG
jgi:hypothetical protein